VEGARTSKTEHEKVAKHRGSKPLSAKGSLKGSSAVNMGVYSGTQFMSGVYSGTQFLSGVYSGTQFMSGVYSGTQSMSAVYSGTQSMSAVYSVIGLNVELLAVLKVKSINLL